MTLTKSKKKICSLLAACCAAAIFAGLAAFVPSVSADAKTESGWSVVKQEGDAVWNVQDDGSVSTLRDSDYDKNFLVCDSDQAYGDYKVSAHFQVSENLAEANGSEIKLGLVPWYLDENNYITATVWWRNVDWSGSGSDKIANLLVYGKQDGQFLKIYKEGSFERQEWTDFWVFNQYSYFSGEAQEILEQPMDIEGGWDFTVEKRQGSDTSSGIDGDELKLILNGVTVGTCLVDMTVPYRPAAQKVGVTSGNMSDALTVTDFKVEDLPNQEKAGTDEAYSFCEYNFNQVEGAPQGTVATGKKGGSWTYSDGTYTGNALQAVRDDTMYQLVSPLPAMSGRDYEVSVQADFTAVEADAEAAAGLIAWYLDHNNYIYADIVKSGSAVQARFSGVISGETIVPVLSDELDQAAGPYVLCATKEGSTLTLFVDNKNLISINNSEIYGVIAYTGLHISGCSANFTQYSVTEAAFNAYDEYMDVFGGVEYTMSSKSLNDFVFENGKLSIDAGDFEQPAYAISAAGIPGGSLTTEVSFAESAVFSKSGYVGIMAYFVDPDHYVFAALTRYSGTDIQAEIYRNEDDVLEKIYAENVSGIVLSDLLTLKTTVQNNEISFYAEDKALIDGFFAGNLPISEKIMSGLVVKGVDITTYLPESDGYRENEFYTLSNEYSARGVSFSTWSVKDGEVTGTAATGELIGDIYTGLWNNVPVPNVCLRNMTGSYTEDYYVYSKINVTKYDSANEFHRVALMPWYIDDSNFLYIAYSHVGANVPDVGVFARVNGVAYNNYDNIGGIASLLNNSLEMDVHITGDDIEIYAGKSPSPIFSCTVSGMAAASGLAIASGKSIMAGYSVYALDAVFSDFSVGTELSAVGTEKPVITFLSARPTSAYVNDTVTLPFIEVVDASGEPINAEVMVTDPDGNQVALVSNARFVTEKTGKYTVTVNAKNSWGISAVPVVWQIEVTEAAEGNPSAGVAIYTALGVSIVLFGVSTAFFIVNKRRNKKSKNI